MARNHFTNLFEYKAIQDDYFWIFLVVSSLIYWIVVGWLRSYDVGSVFINYKTLLSKIFIDSMTY